MDDSKGETHRRPTRVIGKLTRRPKRMRRRLSFFNGPEGLGGFDIPGAEVAEVPIIGPIVLGVFLVIAIVLLVIVFGGFLLAFIELVILGLLALIGWLWAWLRGHPEVAVIDVDDQRWVRDDGPAVSISEDRQSIRAGADPASLGYRRML